MNNHNNNNNNNNIPPAVGDAANASIWVLLLLFLAFARAFERTSKCYRNISYRRWSTDNAHNQCSGMSACRCYWSTSCSTSLQSCTTVVVFTSGHDARTCYKLNCTTTVISTHALLVGFCCRHLRSLTCSGENRKKLATFRVLSQQDN